MVDPDAKGSILDTHAIVAIGGILNVDVADDDVPTLGRKLIAVDFKPRARETRSRADSQYGFVGGYAVDGFIIAASCGWRT